MKLLFTHLLFHSWFYDHQQHGNYCHIKISFVYSLFYLELQLAIPYGDFPMLFFSFFKKDRVKSCCQGFSPFLHK